MKILKRNERDFLTCGDCIHFTFKELIDARFPEAKRGYCHCFDKIVDNHWEINCDEHSLTEICKNCTWLDDYEDICEFHGYVVEDVTSDTCEFFKANYLN
jgi:hypothetical protein